MRREWIEIRMGFYSWTKENGLPPCGGSGLKYHGRIGMAITQCLPPCGGSGLKLIIKIKHGILMVVSLHAEGVD